MSPLAALRRRPWAALELLSAGALIAWRCAAPTWHPVWADLFLYLGLYWALLVLFPDAASGPQVTLGIMLLLLAIYLKGQMPHIMYAFDVLPP